MMQDNLLEDDQVLRQVHVDKFVQAILDMEYLAVFDKTEAQLKEEWGVEDVQDGMTIEQLNIIAKIEEKATMLVQEKGLDPISALKKALKKFGFTPPDISLLM